MEEKTKQRLIGVLVIIGALFIALPFLFHNSRPSLESTLSFNSSHTSTSLTLPATSSTLTNTQNTSTTTADMNALSTASTTPADATTTPITSEVTAPTATPMTNTGNMSNTNIANSTVNTINSTNSNMNNAAGTTNVTSNVTSDISAPAVAANTPNTVNTSDIVNTTDSPTSQATSTPATVSQPTSTAEFSGTPSLALTTGQVNEGPVQSTQVSESVAQSQIVVAAPQPVIAENTLTKVPAASVISKKEITKQANHTSANGWSIQLGVFSDQSNANRLIAQLHAHHYEVYSRHMTLEHRSLVAVLVGPEANLYKAKMLQKQLRREFHLKGEVKKIA